MATDVARDDSGVFCENQGGPLRLSGSWVGVMDGGEQCVLEFTTARMLILSKGGEDVICTYTHEGGVLTIAETGGGTRVYDVGVHSDSKLHLLPEGSNVEVRLVPLDAVGTGHASDAIDEGASSHGTPLDLGIIGTGIPTNSKHLD